MILLLKLLFCGSILVIKEGVDVKLSFVVLAFGVFWSIPELFIIVLSLISPSDVGKDIHLLLIRLDSDLFSLLPERAIISHIDLGRVLVNDFVPELVKSLFAVLSVLLETIEVPHLFVQLQQEREHAPRVQFILRDGVVLLVLEGVVLVYTDGLGFEAGAPDAAEFWPAGAGVDHEVEIQSLEVEHVFHLIGLEHQLLILEPSEYVVHGFRYFQVELRRHLKVDAGLVVLARCHGRLQLTLCHDLILDLEKVIPRSIRLYRVQPRHKNRLLDQNQRRLRRKWRLICQIVFIWKFRETEILFFVEDDLLKRE